MDNCEESLRGTLLLLPCFHLLCKSKSEKLRHLLCKSKSEKLRVSVTAIRVIYVIAELFYYEPINEFDERSFI